MHNFINYLCIFYVVMMLLGAIAIRKALVRRRYVYIYYLISAILLGYFLWVWNSSFEGIWDNHRQYSFGFLLSWLFFTTILTLFVVGEDGIRLLSVPFRLKKTPKIPSRRRFVSLLGLGIASIPFAGMLHGIFRGRYNYRVIKHTLFFDDLPQAFDGYKITHISDIHSGSFDNKQKVLYGIDLINEQQSDVIFFTGDLVNNKAQEMDNWLDVFDKLKAKDGVFSVLGNHDYGDYVQWRSSEEKEANLQQIKKIHKQLGYNLLLNESTFIEKENQRIAIIGVENWGEGFVKKGDLQKALKETEPTDFKLLLSHDPTHWQYQVIENPVPIHLTLSGHTHGMQFGIEIPNWIKWSPVQWRYKYWGGIYIENNRYINVNRGFGYLAFPGRVGMPPEITVIELRKKVA
ncbi:metallophosphoesterase [Capnocytophaga catalasegens]|uniref:Phosphoesterase n=1 Tax=Capnocytophaga catalasegens TaxID=1004260 RepID=A0AAV5AU23_9FLAO|nr:metallophosphoesterase [Capnocytophaga catalasegens]GIZ16163.1 phosphoesterase [Capnocytophaga catalasegens]GJM50893.1 phosphoesterase [Capnocytophaga catalasegens]GJM53737.1 phosphoesterase [Capnocytophaga catalasegens]